VKLTAREIVRRKNQTLDTRVRGQRLHDLGHVGQSHAAVKVMVRLDENADAARTLIEAARLADASAKFREAPRLHLFLQRGSDFLRAFLGTTALRVLIGASVRADKKIALAQRHFVNRRSTPIGKRYLEEMLVEELFTSFGTVVQPPRKTVPSVSNKAKIRMDFIGF